MRLVSIELDQKLLELIDSIAWNEGRSRSSFVRYIIMKELSTIQVPEEKSQKVLE
jgi:metal-responsive CopG/Arc/MetJ family transcriptional regulator